MPLTLTSKNGKQESLERSDGSKAWLLFDFDMEGATLKFEHMRILRHEIEPILEAGGSIDIIGMTDRTGSEALNSHLASQRTRSALSFLKQILPKGTTNVKVALFGGLGTRLAKQQGQPQNTPNERYRAVYVAVWNKPDPPPPPKPSEIKLPDGKQMLDQIQPDQSPLDTSLLGMFGKGADVISAGAGFAEIFAGVALGQILGIGSGLFGAFSAAISSPVAWADQDSVARVNGYIQGTIEAYDDMAAMFRNNALDTKPLDQWPNIPFPLPHLKKIAEPLMMDKAFAKGQMDGASDALKFVRDLESNPKDFKTKDGTVVKVTGKMLLRAIVLSSGGNVKDGVLKAINEQLKKSGHPEFPTR